jgi:hypothetical protein
MIRAIEAYLGADVPSWEGHSADKRHDRSVGTVRERGRRLRGVSVAVFFPSGHASYAFHSGYEPHRARGGPSRVSGRVLHEIRWPAAANGLTMNGRMA